MKKIINQSIFPLTTLVGFQVINKHGGCFFKKTKNLEELKEEIPSDVLKLVKREESIMKKWINMKKFSRNR